MKNLTLIIVLGLFTSLSAFASEYEEAMKSQIKKISTIGTDAEAQDVKNGFLRIAQANMTEWLPMYYAALVQTEAGLRFDVDKDAYFEEAQSYLKILQDAGADNSEITALEGYIMMGMVSVDPGSRGPSMSGPTMETFGRAIGQDRSNPRALYLMAQMERGIAQFFGQGPEKACGMFKRSLELFEAEKDKVDENYLLPSWGHQQALQMAESCN